MLIATNSTRQCLCASFPTASAHVPQPGGRLHQTGPCPPQSHWPGPGELRCCSLGFLLTFLKRKNVSPDHRHRHSLRPTPAGLGPPQAASGLPPHPSPPPPVLPPAARGAWLWRSAACDWLGERPVDHVTVGPAPRPPALLIGARRE